MLVGITRNYRCMSCGADLEQHINGKISYIPTISPKPTLKSKLINTLMARKFKQGFIRKSCTGVASYYSPKDNIHWRVNLAKKNEQAKVLKNIK